MAEELSLTCVHCPFSFVRMTDDVLQESAGLKDVVWLGRNEVVLVEAHYAPWNGVYMFHCHNLIHEDQDASSFLVAISSHALTVNR